MPNHSHHPLLLGCIMTIQRTTPLTAKKETLRISKEPKLTRGS